MGGWHPLLVRAIAVESDEAIHQHKQQNRGSVHFTIPASGLDAVA